MTTIDPMRSSAPQQRNAAPDRPLDLTPLDDGNGGTSQPRSLPFWPVAGALGSAAGFGGALAALNTGVTEEEARTGVDVVDKLARGPFHIAFVLGLVSVAALLVAASGWRRWAERRAPHSIAARTIGSGLMVTATVNVLFTALAGSMALYLPGGTDAGWLSKQAIFVNYTLLDFGSLLGWWGTAVAAMCAAAVSFGRGRLLPRWIGVSAVVLLAPALAAAGITGLPGLVGLFMPVWLLVTSIGMVFSRTAQA
jgi:hypothetical protein